MSWMLNGPEIFRDLQIAEATRFTRRIVSTQSFCAGSRRVASPECTPAFFKGEEGKGMEQRQPLTKHPLLLVGSTQSYTERRILYWYDWTQTRIHTAYLYMLADGVIENFPLLCHPVEFDLLSIQDEFANDHGLVLCDLARSSQKPLNSTVRAAAIYGVNPSRALWRMLDTFLPRNKKIPNVLCAGTTLLTVTLLDQSNQLKVPTKPLYKT